MEPEPFEDANSHAKMNFHCLSVKVLLNHQLWAPWLLTPHHAGSQPFLACSNNTTWIWQVYDYCLGCPPRPHPATVTSRRRSFLFEGSPIDLYFPLLIASSVSFKNATNPTYSPTNIPLSIGYSANKNHTCSFVFLTKNHGIQHACVHNLSRFVEFYYMFQDQNQRKFPVDPQFSEGFFRPQESPPILAFRPFGKV